METTNPSHPVAAKGGSHDLLLRRAIAVFVLAGVLTFSLAVGLAAGSAHAGRGEDRRLSQVTGY